MLLKKNSKQLNVNDRIIGIALAGDYVKKVTLLCKWVKLCSNKINDNRGLNVRSYGQNIVVLALAFQRYTPWWSYDSIEIDINVQVIKEISDPLSIKSVLFRQKGKLHEVELYEKSDAEDESNVSWKQASDASDTFINFAESSKI